MYNFNNRNQKKKYELNTHPTNRRSTRGKSRKIDKLVIVTIHFFTLKVKKYLNIKSILKQSKWPKSMKYITDIKNRLSFL